MMVFVHVTVSVGWLGAGAANVVLAMTAGYTAEPGVREVPYQMIERVEDFVVIPAAFATLVGGIVLGLSTKGRAEHRRGRGGRREPGGGAARGHDCPESEPSLHRICIAFGVRRPGARPTLRRSGS
ncbi:hypothetical protein ACIOD2_49800 [Amycolatopsis sp. NPDC088138]|uniref:hypothetical protein n=1 Tax=Amycolatopsis sp. NPDC088138 TaxID=3363938 RepID=UPI00380E528E